jgi:hypothetical protein
MMAGIQPNRAGYMKRSLLKTNGSCAGSFFAGVGVDKAKKITFA